VVDGWPRSQTLSADRDRLRAELNVLTRKRPPEPLTSRHEFKVGQSVSYLGSGSAPGLYELMLLLPAEGSVFQYRIRNVNEPHERVAK
jgi:hypothetical protein